MTKLFDSDLLADNLELDSKKTHIDATTTSQEIKVSKPIFEAALPIQEKPICVT